MEDPADITAIAAAMHNPADNTDNAYDDAAHLVPSAEGSQNQETAVPAVADAERWPDPVDPANPGGGIKP